MNGIDPLEPLARVARAIPKPYRKNLVVVGSLAAGAAFQKPNKDVLVRTKDMDCLLQPFEVARESAEEIARVLRHAGWRPPSNGPYAQPGSAATPDNDLPAIRLYPPGMEPDSEEAWFVELLTVSEDPSSSKPKAWTRVRLGDEHYGLPSFRYLSVVALDPHEFADLGISCARPELMALANLLQHPRVGPEKMSRPFAGRTIRRSNKDLGRVIALAYLADLADYEPWGLTWETAITRFFPQERAELIQRAGDGLRQLLAQESEEDFEEAWHTSINGLLANQQPSPEAFRAVGLRVLGEAIGRLERFLQG